MQERADPPDLDIVIPVYNEAGNITKVLDALKQHVRTRFRVLICYDHDDDNTLPIVRNYNGLEIILVKNLGKGPHGAVMTGFSNCVAPAILVYPADDDYNAGIVDAMFEKFKQGNDIVAASRFMKGGSMKNCPWLKSFLVRTASFTLYWLSFIPIKDASNGFRLFSKRLIDTVVVESTQGFTYSIEFLVKCRRLRWKISEVPAQWLERTKGQSRFKILKWLPHYLKWYFYAFATTYLNKKPKSVKTKQLEGVVSQNKQVEVEFFDKFGEQLSYDVFTDEGYDRIIQEFLNKLKPLQQNQSNLKIVDLGCGTGAFTAKFLPYGFELHGMDISPNCVNFARTNHPQIQFEIGDIENTQYPDESYDAIFLSGVIHHFRDYSVLLKECHRILKKGGILLAYDPNKSNPFMFLYRCKESPFYSSKGVTENESPLLKKDIRESLQASGFRDISVYSISGITYKYIESPLALVLLPAYNFVERLFDTKLLRKNFGSFNISYAKK